MHRDRGNSNHVVSSCPTIAKTEYLQRHDRVASFIKRILCKIFNLPHTEKRYEHTAQPVTESTEVTILLDFTINTDRKIGANRPDITIQKFEENTCTMLDVTVPAEKYIPLRGF